MNTPKKPIEIETQKSELPDKIKGSFVPLKSNPLDSIQLSGKQTAKISAKVFAGTVASKVPGLNLILELAERTAQESKEQKLGILLGKYEAHFESTDDAINKLKLLATNRSGKILFQKIVYLLDKGTNDEEWLELLSNILRNISVSEFERYFEEHEYVLSQIDRLSPQAMIVLGKYGLWSTVNIQNTTTTSGNTVSGDWDKQVTDYLISKIGVKGSQTSIRVSHSFRELESLGMIVLSGSQLKLSPIGSEVYKMIM